MKIATQIGLAIGCMLMMSLAACQKSDSSPSSDTYAATPQPCNAQSVTPECLIQTAPTGVYPQGWVWPYNWQPSQGYCGCPQGYSPVFIPNGGSAGMACAPNNNFYYMQTVQYFNWGVNFGPAQNGGYTSIPQQGYNNVQAPNAALAQCISQTAQGCDVRIPSHCASGSICQPISGGSTIGLCTRGP